MPTTFVNARFPDKVSFGARGGPEWLTEIVESGSGYTYANQRRSRPIHVYDVSHAARKESLFGLLRAFHYVVNGRGCGFRFKDWSDYKCPDDAGVGIITSSVFYKRYTVGSYTFDRRITRLVSGTIVGLGGSLGTLNLDAGTMSGGSATGWSGEFDVPCRFADDAMAAELIDGPTARRVVGWSGIRIEEILE